MAKLPCIIHTADWHFGHRAVPTEDTIKAMEEQLFPFLPEVDMLIIAGDVFEGIVSFNHPDSNRILNFFADLLVLCYEYDVVVRIVRGTYSHDYNQLSLIDQLYKKLNLNLDYRMFAEISIEVHKPTGLTFLYVPDNIPFSTKEDAFEHIRNLMLASNLKQVDYVVIHGEFANVNFGHGNTVYEVEDFAPLCRYLILAGHIHKPQRYKQLIYAGSFNRLAHGEEEDKGFWLVSGKDACFIPNQTTTYFLTKDYRGEQQFDQLLAKHIEFMKIFGETKQGFLRLMVTDSNIKNALINYHATRHPNVKLTFGKGSKSSSRAADYLNEKLTKKRDIVFEAPSEKNIVSIVYKYLATKEVIIDTSIIQSIIFA